MAWLIDDGSLSTATVEVTIAPGMRLQRGLRVARYASGSKMTRQRVGEDLPQLAWEFVFTGPGADRGSVVAMVAGILAQEDSFVLKNDDSGNEVRIEGAQEWALAAASLGEAYESATGQTRLPVVADFLGVPLSAGGSFVEESVLAVKFLANDYHTATDAAGYEEGVLVGVVAPQQAGYPRAIDPANGDEVALPQFASIPAPDSSGAYPGSVGVYDLNGYVAFEPHAEGEGGPATVLEAPL